MLTKHSAIQKLSRTATEWHIAWCALSLALQNIDKVRNGDLGSASPYCTASPLFCPAKTHSKKEHKLQRNHVKVFLSVYCRIQFPVRVLTDMCKTFLKLLKTKRHLIYTRNQSVPRSKHFPPRLQKPIS
jgi:hypothetical protein